MNYLLAPVLFLVIGLALGSFGNVLVVRVPEGERITGRSRCMRCLKTLGMSELIPVLSYVVQYGRCRGCGTSISWRYPFVESLTAVIFVLSLYLVRPDVVGAFFLAVALWLLLLIAAVDARSRLIPDVFTGLFLVASILAAFALRGELDFAAPLLGGGFFAAQWILSRGRWVGSGDIAVAAGIGILAGSWALTILAIAAAYIVGSVSVLPGLAAGTLKRTDHLPFVPFLFVGTLVVLLWGDDFLRALGM